MRLLIATLAVTFLAIVDVARYHGQYTGQTIDTAWHYVRKVVR